VATTSRGRRATRNRSEPRTRAADCHIQATDKRDEPLSARELHRYRDRDRSSADAVFSPIGPCPSGVISVLRGTARSSTQFRGEPGDGVSLGCSAADPSHHGVALARKGVPVCAGATTTWLSTTTE